MPQSAAATVRLAPIIKTNHAQALALDMHMIQQLHHDDDHDDQQQQQHTPQQQQQTGNGTTPAGGQQHQLGGQPSKAFRGSALNSGGHSAHINQAYSSPQLTQRTAFSTSSPALPRRTSAESHSQGGTASASPLGSSRMLQAQLGQHNTLIYTFPDPPAIAEESESPQHEQHRQQQEETAADAETTTTAAYTAPLASPSGGQLSLSAQLHVAVSSSQSSDAAGRDALLSPGPLHPSSSCSELSFQRSAPVGSQSPTSVLSNSFEPAASSPRSPLPLLGAAIPASDDRCSPFSPHQHQQQAADAGKSLSFAADCSAPASSSPPVSLYHSSSSTSSLISPTALSAPFVVPVGGSVLTARKQCKISEAQPDTHSLLQHCLPCLPRSSFSSNSSSESATSSTRSAAAYRRAARQTRRSRRRIASGDDGCCSNLVTCNPFRLSFRFTLVLLCILQVVVSVGIVWYLGYSNSESLIGSLSSQLRETALVEITGQVHDQMVRPMRAVNQLQYSYGRSQPDLSDLTYGVPNVTGLYADLSFVVFNYPEISGAGCATRNNVFLAAINISAYLAAGASPASTNNITSGFAYAIQLYNDTTAYYRYPPQPTSNTNPNLPVPDYNTSSTVAQLGPVWYTVNHFVPNQRPQYVAAAAAKGAFAWSPVYPLAQASTSTVSVQQNQSVIAAAKAYMTTDGKVGYVCFASVFLSRLGDLLRSLSVSYGANGLALITDRRGVPLASSDNGIMVLTGKHPTWTLCQFPDQRLQAIAAPLAANNVLLSANASISNSPTGDFQFGGVFFQNEPAFAAVPISYGGSAYHLQATILNSTGLDWVIVVVTKDTDFDGDISHHELVVGQTPKTAAAATATICTRQRKHPLARRISPFSLHLMLTALSCLRPCCCCCGVCVCALLIRHAVHDGVGSGDRVHGGGDSVSQPSADSSGAVHEGRIRDGEEQESGWRRTVGPFGAAASAQSQRRAAQTAQRHLRQVEGRCHHTGRRPRFGGE